MEVLDIFFTNYRRHNEIVLANLTANFKPLAVSTVHSDKPNIDLT